MLEAEERLSGTLVDSEFDEVYEEYHRSVYALCHRLVRDDAEAEDATQETFLAVAIGLGRFRGDSSIKTWIHRIAIRTSLKVRTRRQKMLVLDEQAVSESSVSSFHPADSRSLAAALSKLSYEHRLVLSLFSLAGFSHREISEILGIPEGTVWSRLHAAKTAMMALLSHP